MYVIFTEQLARDRLAEARSQAERRRLVTVLRAGSRASRAHDRALRAASKAEEASQRLTEVTLSLVTG